MDERGTVEVWLGAIDGLAAAAERRRGWLSDDERARAEAILSPAARRQFVVRRSALRAILGRARACAPADVVFAYEADGRPRLADGAGPGFNVSHTADVLAVAVAGGGRPGVDVEPARGPGDAEALAARFFAVNEAQAIAALAEADRPRAFVAAWTAKEAVVKAIGEGIGYGVERVEVTAAPGAPVRLVALGGDADVARRWSLFAFEAPCDHVGALAIEGRWRFVCRGLDAGVLDLG